MQQRSEDLAGDTSGSVPKDALLPCPFCGSIAKPAIYSGNPTIFCRGCPALMGGEESSLTDRELLEAWNRRALAQAYERCAKVCDVFAVEADEDMSFEGDERFGVYAKKYRKAAAAIRALAVEPGTPQENAEAK